MPYKDPKRRQEASRKWREKHPEYAKEWRSKNRDRIKAYLKAYLSNYTKSAKFLEWKRNYYAKNEMVRLKARARATVGNNIKAGKLTKQPCVVCGASERVHAHHEDYSKPLEIIWLCYSHHRQHHERPM